MKWWSYISAVSASQVMKTVLSTLEPISALKQKLPQSLKSIMPKNTPQQNNFLVTPTLRKEVMWDLSQLLDLMLKYCSTRRVTDWCILQMMELACFWYPLQRNSPVLRFKAQPFRTGDGLPLSILSSAGTPHACPTFFYLCKCSQGRKEVWAL